MNDELESLITRDDTFFGVCEAIGEDFGFHANWLRIALAVGTFFSPLGAVAAYAALGVLVLASRLLAPAPAPRTAAAAAGASAAEPTPAEAPAEERALAAAA